LTGEFFSNSHAYVEISRHIFITSLAVREVSEQNSGFLGETICKGLKASNMGGAYENQFDEEAPLIRQLTKGQRRVLGVLVEKGLTTPGQYPLTLKAATTGANQTSNRDPVTSFSETAVWELLDEVRELGLISVVHPESGRTERYRHYLRRRYPFNEQQLAIMTELFLRGRQQLGELRARASRMVPIENLDALRRELTSLLEQGFIQASGSLERRGIEVDHNMYMDNEGGKVESTTASAAEVPQQFIKQSEPTTSQPTQVQHSDVSASEFSDLKDETAILQSEVEDLKQIVQELQDSLDDLRKSLGA
jgi:uncharacterized protein